MPYLHLPRFPIQPPWEGPPLPGGLVGNPYENEYLREVHAKWRELDELQIKVHHKCMSTVKWKALNSLNAIGLELTKGYPAIAYYIEEKTRRLDEALKDLEYGGEVIR